MVETRHLFLIVSATFAIGCSAPPDRADTDWTFSTFDRHFWNGYCSMTSPVVDGGIIYVGGGYAWDNRTALFALEEASGRELWRQQIGPAFTGNEVLVDSSRVYVAAGDTLIALDRKTGAPLWRRANAGRHRAHFGDAIYASGYGRSVSAFEASTGQELWRREMRESIDTMSVLGENLYVVTGARLIAIDRATGDTTEAATSVRPVSWVTALDTTLLIGTRGADTNWVIVEWNPATNAVDTIHARLASAQKDVIVFTAPGATFALDRVSRREVWRSPAPSTARLGGARFRHGVMYQANYIGELRKVDAFDVQTGARRWTLETGDLVRDPVLATNHVLVSSDDCRVYAIRMSR